MLSCLDITYHMKKQNDMIFGEGGACPEELNKLCCPGNYNGAHLKKIWVIFYNMCEKREDLIQSKFQGNHDFGHDADHEYIFSKRMSIPK